MYCGVFAAVFTENTPRRAPAEASQAAALDPRPRITRARTRTKAASFGYADGVTELAGEGVWFMSVASEGDRRSAFVMPPSNDFQVERPFGVDLQCPAAASQRTERVTELLLERIRIERPGRRRPVTERVVDMREHGERTRTFDEVKYLGEILPHDIRGW